MRSLTRRITLPFTIMLILLSLTVQGAYAIEENTTKERVPPMDTDYMKERTAEMIKKNIESLDALQSETDNDELNDSIDGLLAQLDALKSELESAEDENEILEIMNELRTLIEDSPEEIREALRENGMMGEPEQNSLAQGNNSMGAPAGEGIPERGGPGMNDTMMNRTMRDSGFGQENGGEKQAINNTSDDENNGLLSGLINKIKTLFQ